MKNMRFALINVAFKCGLCFFNDFEQIPFVGWVSNYDIYCILKEVFIRTPLLESFFERVTFTSESLFPPNSNVLKHVFVC